MRRTSMNGPQQAASKMSRESGSCNADVQPPSLAAAQAGAEVTIHPSTTSHVAHNLHQTQLKCLKMLVFWRKGGGGSLCEACDILPSVQILFRLLHATSVCVIYAHNMRGWLTGHVFCRIRHASRQQAIVHRCGNATFTHLRWMLQWYQTHTEPKNLQALRESVSYLHSRVYLRHVHIRHCIS